MKNLLKQILIFTLVIIAADMHLVVENFFLLFISEVFVFTIAFALFDCWFVEKKDYEEGN